MQYLTNKDLELLTNFVKKNMKLKQIINSVEGINYLLKKELPMVLARKLSKVAKEAGEELKQYNEIKESKIKELGEEVLDEDNKPTGEMKIKDENLETWNKEIEELIDQDVEINVPDIKAEEFVNSEGNPITIEPWVINNLDWLIKEE